MSETWVQVIVLVGSNLAIMLTFFGVSISLHNGIREEIREIHACLKDHHARISVIEEKK